MDKIKLQNVTPDRPGDNKWDRSSLKNPHNRLDKRAKVRTMFGSISGSYDTLNHLLSLNMDRTWRRKAARCAIGRSAGRAGLDICCGTGDLAIAFAEARPGLEKIVGIDFSDEMIKLAERKYRKYRITRPTVENTPEIEWLSCDAEKIPFPSESFDYAGCAFGLRNTQAPQAVLKEAHRLLRPGGILVILEFAIPKSRIAAWLYQCYFRLCVPFLGTLISSDASGAYHYLPQSVCSFETRRTLQGRLGECGFEILDIEPLTAGAVLLFTAKKI